MAASSPERVCMSRTKSSMSASWAAWPTTTRSGPSATTSQVVVGDQGGDLDDDVALRVEAGHLEVHPGQHRARCYREVPARPAPEAVSMTVLGRRV